MEASPGTVPRGAACARECLELVAYRRVDTVAASSVESDFFRGVVSGMWARSFMVRPTMPTSEETELT